MSNFSLSSFQNSKVANFSRNRLIALKQLLVLRFKNYDYAHDPLTHGSWSRGPGQHGGKRLESGELPGVPRLSMRKVVSATAGGNAGGGTGKKIVGTAKLTNRQKIQKFYDDYQKIKGTLTPTKKLEVLAKISSRVEVLEKRIAITREKTVALTPEQVKAAAETTADIKLMRSTAKPSDASLAANKKGPAATLLIGSDPPIRAADSIYYSFNAKTKKWEEKKVFDTTTAAGRNAARAQQRIDDKELARVEVKKLGDSSKRIAGALTPSQRANPRDVEDAEEASAGFFKERPPRKSDERLDKYNAMTDERKAATRETLVKKLKENIAEVLKPANITRMALGVGRAETWSISATTREILGKQTVSKIVKSATAQIKKALDAENMKLFKTTSPTAAQVESIASGRRTSITARSQLAEQKRANQQVLDQNKTGGEFERSRTNAGTRTDDQEIAALLKIRRPPNDKTVAGQREHIRKLEDKAAFITSKSKPTTRELGQLKQLEKRIDTARGRITEITKGKGAQASRALALADTVIAAESVLLKQINKRSQILDSMPRDTKEQRARVRAEENKIKQSVEYKLINALGNVKSGRATQEDVKLIQQNAPQLTSDVKQIIGELKLLSG